MNMTVELNRMRQTIADRNSSIAGQRQQLANLHRQLLAAQTDRDRSEKALRDALQRSRGTDAT